MSLFSRIQAWRKIRSFGPLEICEHEYDYQIRLNNLWGIVESKTEHIPQEYIQSKADEPLFSRKPSPLNWKIAFTSAFSKAIANADRTMQGRILIAIAELSSDPATRRGDTVKPLVGDRQGCWRYRLGDYRLIYSPNMTERMVVLVDFSSRASVYQ